MILNPCIYCGASAAEQIRGIYHKDNREDRPENHHPGAILVEMSPATEDDFRIACSRFHEHDHRRPQSYPQCLNALNWNLPTLKEAEKMRKRWNAENPSSVDQYGV